MIIRSLLAAALVLGSSLVYAQVCPPIAGSVCLVPSRTASTLQATTYMTPMTSAMTTVVVPYTGTATGICPTVGLIPMTGMTAYQTNVSGDALYLSNQIAALRNDVRSLQGTVRAMALTTRGQQLITQVNQLIAEEMVFRQLIAANPNLPGAQATALSLTARAETLTRELADFNRELSMIPADERPLVAQELTTFTTAYWNPTMQRFADYRLNFAGSGTSYQPAFAANPWLQQWHTGFQADLASLGGIPQQYAQVNWWSDMRVAGTVETFPGGTMTLPNGTIVYIPAGTILTPSASTTGTTTGTTPMTN